MVKKNFGFKKFLGQKKFLGSQKFWVRVNFWVRKSFGYKKNVVPKKFWAQKKRWFPTIFGQKTFWFPTKFCVKKKILQGQMLLGQIPLWQLESVLDVSRNLFSKFHQIRVSNSWYIADLRVLCGGWWWWCSALAPSWTKIALNGRNYYSFYMDPIVPRLRSIQVIDLCFFQSKELRDDL